MANKKKKKANRPKTATAPVPASDKLAKEKEEFEAALEAEPKSDSKQELESESTSKNDDAAKEKEKDKGKDKEKSKPKEQSKGKTPAVIKSQARAKDPKKANKKPNIFRRFIDYLRAVRLEIKRTTWPTRSEVLNMAIIVLVALLFFGVLIFLIDRLMVLLLDLYAELVPLVQVDPSAAAEAADAAAEAAADVDPDAAATGLFSFMNLSNLKSLIGW